MDVPPLRVLQVLRRPVGGAFRYVCDLTRELDRRGHEVGVVVDDRTFDGLTHVRLDELRTHTALGVHLLTMPRVLGPADLTTAWRVRRLAHQLDADVVHGHGSKGGVYARLGAGRSPRLAVSTPHGGVLHYEPRSSAGRVFHGIERALRPLTDVFVFESDYADRTFRALVVEPGRPAPVVRCGLYDEEFDPVPADADAHEFVFVGELRTLKGIEHLLDALVDVRTPGGEAASLALAGEGSDVEAVRARIVRLGLTGRVELLGAIPAREAFRRGRVLVAPSLSESLPYVVLEACAAGRPAIATKVGGVPEIFGPTGDELLPPADARALRAAMQHALDDPAAASRSAATRRDYVRDRFSIDEMTDRIAASYRSVVATTTQP